MIKEGCQGRRVAEIGSGEYIRLGAALLQVPSQFVVPAPSRQAIGCEHYKSILWLGQGLRKEAALGHGAGRIDVAPVVYEEVNDLAMAVANGLSKQGAAIRSPFGGQCGDLGDPRR